jgi:hypothetical protein
MTMPDMQPHLSGRRPATAPAEVKLAGRASAWRRPAAAAIAQCADRPPAASATPGRLDPEHRIERIHESEMLTEPCRSILTQVGRWIVI